VPTLLRKVSVDGWMQLFIQLEVPEHFVFFDSNIANPE
jgi:hypothetical protein